MAKINFKDLAAAAEKQARENERHDKPEDEASGKAGDKAAEKAAATTIEKAATKAAGRTVGKAAAKTSGKPPSKTAGKTPGKASDKAASKPSGKADASQAPEKAAPAAHDALYKFTTYIPTSLKMDLDIFVAQQKFMGVKCSRIIVVEKALRAYLSQFSEGSDD